MNICSGKIFPLPLILSFLLSCKSGDQNVQSGSDIHGAGEGYDDLIRFGPIPEDLDKRLQCPLSNKDATGFVLGKTRTYKTSAEVNYSKSGWATRVASDWTALSKLVPPDMEVVVIDIRRVNGQPAYFYFSNEKQFKAYEPWSSSKFMAITAAVSRIRERNSKVGADGKAGKYNIGDLITAVHTYAAKGNAPGGGPSGVGGSNSISNYFTEIAGRDYFTSLFRQKWLMLPDADGSKFEGGYGTGFYFDPGVKTLTGVNGDVVEAPRYTEGYIGDKPMSALAQAEWLKRLTQFVADPHGGRMPGLQEADIRVLLYGSDERKNDVGGMLAGKSVYLAQALLNGQKLGSFSDFGGKENAFAKKHFDSKTGGKWRFFQKLGAGVSSTRKVSEIVMASYACLPEFDGGREFVIVASAHRNTLPLANEAMVNAFSAIVPALVPGFAPTLK